MELQKKWSIRKFRSYFTTTCGAIFILHKRGQFYNLLFIDYSPTPFVKLFHIKIKGGITIQKEKTYYNQKDIIYELHKATGYPINNIAKILNSVGDIIRDKFSSTDNSVEIKLFPGLKVTSKYIPSDQSVSKHLNIKSDYSIFMSAIFTDDFRKKVRELHNRTT